MKSLFQSAGLSMVAVAVLCAQSTTTQTNPQTQNTGQTSSAPTGSSTGSQTGSTAMGQPQTWTGVLIDASCQDVSSMKPVHSSTSTTSRETSSASTTPAGQSSTSQSTAQRSDRTMTADGTAAREQKETRTSETNRTDDATTGTRSRTNTQTSSSSSQTTAAGAPVGSTDPYPNCHATTSTTSFALASSGQVYFLDEASNSKVRQQMSTDSSFMGSGSSSAPMSVVIMGNGSGPEITVTSIQRSNR